MGNLPTVQRAGRGNQSEQAKAWFQQHGNVTVSIGDRHPLPRLYVHFNFCAGCGTYGTGWAPCAGSGGPSQLKFVFETSYGLRNRGH
mmetsp:Transcript_27606/g.54140  ORF Transcript_27606/g.54140 Transcript_27606/m.54140 type:complete len:87 (-) Transcript_27606:1015-1275(-)